MMNLWPALLLVLVVCLPRAVQADAKDPTKSDLPLQLRLVAKKTTYQSDITSEELKKQLEAARQTGRFPSPPVVDMVLEITNRSDREIAFWDRGDPVQVGLELKGPGAIPVTPLLGFTADFRLPQATKLAPGKTHAIPITSLRFGFRGAGQMVFWTDPGEYTLTATYKTALSPAPEGLKADESGFAPVTLKSEPVKIKVEKK